MSGLGAGIFGAPVDKETGRKAVTEIKSTIDLIMERTRGMRLSREEKEDVRREEMSKRAKGLRLKLLEAPDDVQAALASMTDVPEEDRQLIMDLLWVQMVQAIPSDERALKHLSIMADLPQGPGKADVLNKVRSVLRSGIKHRHADRKKMLNTERKRLASFGISGTAVVPRLPKNAVLDAATMSELDHLKKDLLS